MGATAGEDLMMVAARVAVAAAAEDPVMVAV